MDKEKIKEILLNIFELILKYNEINNDFLSDLNENYSIIFESIFKNIIDLNNRFSYYKIRKDLDREEEAKRLEALREELNKKKEETIKLQKEYFFNMSQKYLKIKVVKDLIEDIRHLIDDL